ncbi:MAG: PBP1A family penicillin-binding protein [Candidatus Latescibacteria bacterium]|nr:PBP1A family penicillin-binding protein [Candidatus Latescibacterota bacterium]
MRWILLLNDWTRTGVLLAADALLVAGLGFAWLLTTLPQIPPDPGALSSQAGVSIFADTGELLFTFNRSVRQVRLDQVSPWFVKAVIATEDESFYRHRGVSLKGIAGAFLTNLRHFRNVRGGSTITQQIVKNVFLTREKTYLRKAREALLAVQLEAMFSRLYGGSAKDRLLEIYINGSFFGTNAYGVEDASQTFFGKAAADLSLIEAAMLAGLPNSPGALNPFRDGGRQAAVRTAHVLRRMHAAGFLETDALKEALAASPVLASQLRDRNRTPYFVEIIKEEVVRQWGRSALSFGALNIYTTLDYRMQKAAEHAVEEGLADVDERLGFGRYESAGKQARREYIQAALVSLEPATGYVRALVGGRDIFISYFNRATASMRQPGSGFKPVVYLAALASGGISSVSLFVDEPRTYTVNGNPWMPENFRDRYLGMTTAAWALVNSANSASVQVLDLIGAERVVEMGQRLGIRRPLDAYPSIALGANEVSPLEMASVYATIANYGVRVNPTYVRRIEDSGGRVVYEHRVQPVPVIDAADAYVMIRLLQNVILRGTGRGVRSGGFVRPAAGKTGTTNGHADAWFTGFTPDLATCVWVGFDRKTGRQTRITGGRDAVPIWTAFMTRATAGRATRDFWMPADVYEVSVDVKTGVSADSSAASTSHPAPILVALKTGERANSPRAVAEYRAAAADSAN